MISQKNQNLFSRNFLDTCLEVSSSYRATKMESFLLFYQIYKSTCCKEGFSQNLLRIEYIFWLLKRIKIFIGNFYSKMIESPKTIYICEPIKGSSRNEVTKLWWGIWGTLKVGYKLLNQAGKTAVENYRFFFMTYFMDSP